MTFDDAFDKSSMADFVFHALPEAFEQPNERLMHANKVSRALAKKGSKTERFCDDTSLGGGQLIEAISPHEIGSRSRGTIYLNPNHRSNFKYISFCNR